MTTPEQLAAEIKALAADAGFSACGITSAAPFEEYIEALRTAYRGRVRGRADRVVYWFQKAAEMARLNVIRAFGLVATKSIAKGASRDPLDLLISEGSGLIFDAWTNEAWVVEGAAVRVAWFALHRHSSESLYQSRASMECQSIGSTPTSPPEST